jgi:asparagine synthase (glutamine-hydrolysing)
MCGIVGFISTGVLTDEDIARGRRLRDGLAHRGPDGAGEWLDRARGIYLGHRRLSIVDLSDASAQPMSDDGLVLSFNGEIYNYMELRAELANMRHFRTTGDTEVLLAAWHKWGAAALDRLDGMFAISLFDGEQMHLATDPFGEKPIYWAKTPRGCWFCSEADVLARELGLTFGPSPAEAQTFLALGFLPAPATGIPSLHEVPAATHGILTAEGFVRSRHYWTPPVARAAEGEIRGPSERELDEIGEAILESLRRRMRADVPVGLFLSAGVDSSLLAAMAARELGLKLQTLTVAFPDGKDESGPAGEIARYLGLPHKTIDSREATDWQHAPMEMADMFGVPSDNLTALSVRQMSALARQDMTVALSGLGGDELFFGYNRHLRLWAHRHLHRLGPPVAMALRPMAALLRAIPRVGAALDELAGSPAWRFLSAKNNSLGGIVDRLALAVSALSAEFPGDRDLVYEARDFDVRRSLPGNYIPSVDRASMRVGLEVRAPFLSRAIAECIGRMDARALVAGGQKVVLRRLLARYLPAGLVDRPKQGFVFPAARYLAGRDANPPAAAGIDPELAAGIWRQRADGRYRSFALRLCILEALSNRTSSGPDSRFRDLHVPTGELA